MSMRKTEITAEQDQKKHFLRKKNKTNNVKSLYWKLDELNQLLYLYLTLTEFTKDHY